MAGGSVSVIWGIAQVAGSTCAALALGVVALKIDSRAFKGWIGRCSASLSFPRCSGYEELRHSMLCRACEVWCELDSAHTSSQIASAQSMLTLASMRDSQRDANYILRLGLEQRDWIGLKSSIEGCASYLAYQDLALRLIDERMKIQDLREIAEDILQ